MIKTMPTDLMDGIIQKTFDFGRIMRKKMMKADKGDLHMGQLHILSFIQEQPGITMTDIADLMRVSSPTATSFVDRLVKLEYIVRRHDTENRKLVRLDLTELGKNKLKEKMAEKKRIIADVLSVLSPEDQKSLLSILTTIVTRSQK